MKTKKKLKQLVKEILLNQIQINEQNFFLNLSMKLNLDYKTTVYQIKEIHFNIINEKKTLNDYSLSIQKLYKYYLHYLQININD
jgi:predicted transcriptional regulator